MTAFAGVVVFEADRTLSAYTDALSAIIRRNGVKVPRVQRSARAIVAHGGAPMQARSDGTLFATSARLENRQAIAAAVGVAPHEGDPELIRTAFDRNGARGVADLLGAFAFAHWREATGELTLVRDYNGSRSLFFHRGDGFVAFASLLADLLAIPGVPRALDETMMANFLALNLRQADETLYQGLVRVPSRTLVSIDAKGARASHYWSPKPKLGAPYKTDADYIERGRELFDIAVKRNIEDLPRLAILTSGGFDSSAVAATAARLGHPDITCYTGVPKDGSIVGDYTYTSHYFDERPKIEALRRMHPSLKIRYMAPEGPHAIQVDPRRVFLRTATPLRNIGNMMWFAAFPDAAMADGHKVLLNGSMGNMGLTWSGDFTLSVLFQHGRILPLLREARAIAKGARRPFLRVLIGQTILRIMPPAAQRAYVRLVYGDPGDVGGFSALKREAREALDLDAIWARDGYDPRFRMTGDPVTLRTHQLFDQNQMGRDLQASFVENAGYEMRDPHADRDLLEFCLSVPEWVYCRDGVKRWFARQVLADRLPPEILQENRRGQQSPNWFDAMDARKAEIGAEIERLETSPMSRRLIDIDRLKALYAEWPKDALEAESRATEFGLLLDRAVHTGQFIRWVEGGNG